MRVAPDTCPNCGRALLDHDQHVRFGSPDAVLPLLGATGPGDVWMSGESPNDSVFMSVRSAGSFVRALLPVRLADGHSVTYGVWVGLEPEAMKSVVDSWWSPRYADLRVEGRLANAIAPWKVFELPALLEVRDPDQTPYVVGGSPELEELLNGEWPHELVMPTLPSRPTTPGTD